MKIDTESTAALLAFTILLVIILIGVMVILNLP